MTHLVLKIYAGNVAYLESDKDGHEFPDLESATDHAVAEACHRQGKYIVVKIEDIYQGENYDEKANGQ